MVWDCRGLWHSSLAVGETVTAALVCMAEMEAGIAVEVGAAKTVEAVGSAELKAAGAAGAAGIGAPKTVAVVGRVESKATAAVAVVAAAAGIETTKTAAVALAVVLLGILRPHAGTGNVGLEQGAMDCVTQRVVAGIVGEFDFVVVQCAELDFRLGNTPQADMPDSGLDMKGFG